MSVLSEGSVKKLEAVRDAILAEPAMYNQFEFPPYLSPCRRACCLAGWAVWNKSPKLFAKAAKDPQTGWMKLAHEALGTKHGDWSGGLFGTGSAWEAGYGEKLHDARGATGRARVAAQYIDHLIRKYGPKTVSK